MRGGFRRLFEANGCWTGLGLRTLGPFPKFPVVLCLGVSKIPKKKKRIHLGKQRHMIGLWTLSAFRLGPPSRTLSTLQAVVQPPLTFCSPYTIKQNLGRKRKALGRGQANGKGKRGGRGNKGYKARNHRAFPTPGFEGGQSGLIKALPKIGHQAQQK